MDSNLILYPILLHIILLCLLYILLAVRKSAAVKSGNVDLKVTALNNHAWPAAVLKVRNNIANNFESPVLFYGAVVATYLLGQAGNLAVTLSFAYIVLRYVHSYIHTGSNYVPHRMQVFALSLLVLLALVIQTVLGTLAS